MEEMRINKYLSNSGKCSRREADRLIQEGRVYINGQKAENGVQVGKDDVVTLDGKEVVLEETEVFLAFYKPCGLICTTAHEENGEKIKNVVDYINYPKRIYPVGRLDRDSEGLLLLTNNGEVMNLILKSRYEHEKEYFVKLNKSISDADIKKMASGVHIVDEEKGIDTITKKCKVRRDGDSTIYITLTQGINRQIRRMCDAVGYRVVSLKRERIMNITLAGLTKGRYRELSKAEIDELKRQCRY